MKAINIKLKWRVLIILVAIMAALSILLIVASLGLFRQMWLKHLVDGAIDRTRIIGTSIDTALKAGGPIETEFNLRASGEYLNRAQAILKAQAPSKREKMLPLTELCVSDPFLGRWICHKDKSAQGIQWGETQIQGETLKVFFKAGQRRIYCLFSMAPFYKDLDRITQGILLYLTLDIALLILLGFVIFRKMLIQPVQRIVEAIENITFKDPQLNLNLPEKYEIGVISYSVNRLVKRIMEEKEQSEKYIQELQSLNKSLAETREHLIRSEKFATIGRLSAGISHEIGNPLSSIMGFSELLLKTIGPTDPSYMMVQKISQESERIDQIIRGLKELAYQGKVNCEDLSVTETIQESLDIVRAQKKFSSIEIANELGAAIPQVWADRNNLRQVLINLLLNATDAMNNQGKIRLFRKKLPLTSNFVGISIADSGPGIDLSIINKIFDPFFTTKEVGRGTGLGLAISYQMMVTMAGDIQVENLENGGACFTLFLKKGDRH